MTPVRTLLMLVALASSGTAMAQSKSSSSSASEDGTAEDFDGFPPKRARREGGFSPYLPPFRFGMRTGIREDTNPSFLLELGVQVTRSEHWKLDANVSFAFPHSLRLGNLFRTMSELDVTADALFVAGRRLEIGPTGGVSHRFYQQQWQLIDNAWVPVVGVRANTPLVRARRWSWDLDVRGRVDLARTQMVIETQEVSFMSPWEIQIGTRFNFGYGRRPAN